MQQQAHEKRREVMQNQQQWLRQRQQKMTASVEKLLSSTDNKKVALPSSTTTSTTNISQTNNNNDISSHVNEILKYQILQDVIAPQQQQQQLGKQKMDRFLSDEIESHKCSICMEDMIAPKLAPVSLFPCGHTFCMPCITQHMKSKQTCPLCRTKITNHAVNIPLQQIIASFAEKRKEIVAQQVKLENDQAEKYKREHRNLHTRCQILQNELHDSMAEMQDLKRRQDYVKKIILQKQEEEVQAAERVKQAMAQVEQLQQEVSQYEAMVCVVLWNLFL